MRSSLVRYWVHIALLCSFLLQPILTTSSAFAQGVGGKTPDPGIWYYGPIEDPRLVKIVGELKEVLHVLWKMLWSFDWIKHPGQFFHQLWQVFHLWFQLITELFAVLLEHLHILEKEIAGSKCQT